jgi:tRNA G18 (ribose-2'-O)-methylase SpoU
MPQIPVQSIDDPRLACYRDVTQRNLTRQSGLFIAEGDKVAERLANSRFEVASILAEPEHAERFERLTPAATPIYVASRQLLAEIAGFQFHRGVLACGRRAARSSVAELLPGRDGARATIVVLPDVQDPTNLGSIIRSTAAFGCEGIVLGPRCADPFSRRVLRVSMGAAFHLPIVESTDLTADLRAIADAGLEVAAAVIDATAEPLATARRSERLAIVLGGEGHGLSEEWLKLCHRRVTIPMQLGIDSLNVAVAAAVLLYHFAGS